VRFRVTRSDFTVPVARLDQVITLTRKNFGRLWLDKNDSDTSLLVSLIPYTLLLSLTELIALLNIWVGLLMAVAAAIMRCPEPTKMRVNGRPGSFFCCYYEFNVICDVIMSSHVQQRWADCHILRSGSSLDLKKLSPSPTTFRKIFQT